MAIEFDKGIDIIGIGEMGIGNTTASSAIAAVYTNSNVEDLTGAGTGIDESGLLNKIQVIQKALEKNNPDRNDAIDVLSKVGGFEIGGLAGVILAAAEKRIPVILDGFISGAAALIACNIEPKVKDLKRQEIKKEREIVISELSRVKKRTGELSSVPNVRNIRRPRLERPLGRGGLLRRQKQFYLLDNQKRNLLKRKKLLDKLLEKKDDKRKVF